jgi:hypothetical protein
MEEVRLTIGIALPSCLNETGDIKGLSSGCHDDPGVKTVPQLDDDSTVYIWGPGHPPGSPGEERSLHYLMKSVELEVEQVNHYRATHSTCISVYIAVEKRLLPESGKHVYFEACFFKIDQEYLLP